MSQVSIVFAKIDLKRSNHLSEVANNATSLPLPLHSTSKLKSTIAYLALLLSGFLGMSSATAQDAGHLLDELMIQELMARYMFAMDWRNADDFVATFTEDAVLEYSQGAYRGHEALRNIIVNASQREVELNEKEGKHKPVQRTTIHNVVSEINGDTAKAWSYWSVIDNRTNGRKPRLLSFGHYEDELVKIDGRWLFNKRVIYSENSETKHSSYNSPLSKQE